MSAAGGSGDATFAAMMQRGHASNAQGEYAEARRAFRAAYAVEARHEAYISAANMAYKLHDDSR